MGPIPIHKKHSDQHLKFRRALLAWYRRHARVLPWRKDSSPYKIWVSEIMLQQTQVATVIPYYLRFLDALPTIENLAHAKLERVLELWSGLGYYRRARNLHAAARVVVRDFGGKFPEDYRSALSLPGVGDYTARAILSIAYGKSLALMDGNVARVVARVRALKGNICQPSFRSAVSMEIDQLLAPRSPGDFNQAMMELGQTVCLPRGPRCFACPWQKWCKGFRTRKPEAYPEPRPRRDSELHYLAVAIIRRGNRVAVVRGLDDGLLMDLWNYPSSFGRSKPASLTNLKLKLGSLLPGATKIGAHVGEVRHTITHRAIRVFLYPVKHSGPVPDSGLHWLPSHSLGRFAISQLARKISAKLAGLNILPASCGIPRQKTALQ